MAKYDEALLVTAIEQHEAKAETYGNLQDDRATALEYYKGEPLGNEVEGRSQVVYRSVFDTVEWIKPQLADIFTSGEDIISFSPRGPEDVKAAEQETDYTNHVITERNPWFDIFLTWCHDALVQKVGYVKAYWDDSIDTVTERYVNLTDDEFRQLLLNDDIEITEHEESVIGYDPTGAFVIKTHTVAVQRSKPENITRIENLAPEHVRVSQNARKVSLQDRRVDFVEHRERKTISELREDGFDVEDDISDGGESADDWEQNLRDEYNPFQDADDASTADPSMRRVTVREVWIRFDKNKDGKAELLHVVIVGDTVLHCEETDLIPIVAMCPIPQAHQHYGMSIADAVMDLQRIQTALLRGALDNQYLANNGRYGINQNNVNLDDMLDSRAGGVVRVDGDPGGNIMPLTHPTNGQVAIPTMEYVERIASRRTGVNEMSQGLDPNALNNQAGANANSQMMTAAMQRIRFIARVFAEMGVRNLFQVVHALSLKHSRQAEMVQMRGEWVPVNPRNWVKRKDLSVTLTLGTGDKPQQIAMLQAIGMAQKEGLGIGITKPKNLYNTATRLTKLMGHKDVSQFWTDPGDEPIKPPPDPKIQVAQMQLQADQQKFQAQSMLDEKLEMIRNEFAGRQKQMELELQASNDQRDADREQIRAQYDRELKMMEMDRDERLKAAELELQKYKIDRDNEVKLMTAQMSTGAEVPTTPDVTGGSVVDALHGTAVNALAETSGVVQGGVQAMGEQNAQALNAIAQVVAQASQAIASSAQQITQAAQVISKPKKIVRGPDGKVMGVE